MCIDQLVGPGYKDQPNLADLGYPIAIVNPFGEAVVTNTPGIRLDVCAPLAHHGERHNRGGPRPSRTRGTGT